MDCQIITDFAGIAALEQDWKRLWGQSPRPEIFNSFDYVSAWWSVHGPSYSIFTPIVRDGSRVVAILPLILHRDVLHFFCFTDADFFDLLCEIGAEYNAIATIFAELNKHRARWKWAVLDNVPQASPLLQAANFTQDSGLRGTVRPINICPTLDLRMGRDESFARLLGSKRDRQEERRLARFGEITFAHLQSREAIRTALQGFFQQHTDRWAMEGARGRFTNELSRRFYTAMVERLDPARELRFSVLRAGNKDMAYHLGFQCDGRMLFFKPTFDIDYWEYSPGKVLLQKLLQYAKDTALEEFDFSIGDEDYKKKFANNIRTNYRIVITNGRIRSRIKRIQLLIDSTMRTMIGEEEIASVRGWRDSVFRPGWARELLSSLRLKGTAAAYSIKPGPAIQTGEPLHEGSLSWLAQTALHSSDFVSLAELQNARDWIKDGWRFVYVASASGTAGGWLKEEADFISLYDARSTSEESLQLFLAATRRMVQETGIEARLSLRN